MNHETQARLTAEMLQIGSELAALKVLVAQLLAITRREPVDESHAEMNAMAGNAHAAALEAIEDVSPARAAQLDTRPLSDD